MYVHYEEGSDAELHVTLKLTLPKKWNDESPMKLLQVPNRHRGDNVNRSPIGDERCRVGRGS